MGKREYRAYIQSEKWQTRRREFLAEHKKCNECGLPRYLSVLIFDEDLHVDHRNYQNVGSEPDSDLQALCKRCHEIKHFGRSNLPNPSTGDCALCERPMWDRYSDEHEVCGAMESTDLQMTMVDWDITLLRIAATPARRKPVAILLRELEKLSPGKNADHETIIKISGKYRGEEIV